MDIRQAVLGAGVAALLVLGGDGEPAGAKATTLHLASLPAPACDIAGLKEAMRDAAQRAGSVALDVVLDVAGELKARIRQVF